MTISRSSSGQFTANGPRVIISVEVSLLPSSLDLAALGVSQRLLRPASRFLRRVRFSSKEAAVLAKSCWMPTAAENLGEKHEQGC